METFYFYIQMSRIKTIMIIQQSLRPYNKSGNNEICTFI
jgi:hypothetical protein